MKRAGWLAIGALVVIGLFILFVSLPFLIGWIGWGPRWFWTNRGGWGMMGPGVMGGWSFGPLGWLGMILMWLFPLGLLVLLILGIVWLAKVIAQPEGQTLARPSRTCPACGRPVQAEWRHCPDCGHSLPQ
ncbi:MAG: zinc ribbon domain-containing protein [Anaerolineae bacterium]|nr:zinc ribbon domain-containing protein [Anaerolineae bacterium]MDW8098819.1 zinc ribbon domain-containing protein [Anaerolineae bacterium]